MYNKSLTVFLNHFFIYSFALEILLEIVFALIFSFTELSILFLFLSPQSASSFIVFIEP